MTKMKLIRICKDAEYMYDEIECETYDDLCNAHFDLRKRIERSYGIHNTQWVESIPGKEWTAANRFGERFAIREEVTD